MKKIIFGLITAGLLLTFNPIQSSAMAATTPTSITATKAAEIAEVKTLSKRLDEIKAMDKTKLTSSEKQVLRKEVRTIKHQMSNIGGGVYISVGGLLLIILILVILL